MTEAPNALVSGAEKRRQALQDARRRDSEAKRALVRDTVEKMLLDGERISFAAVARRANVSNWLVYADGVRARIEVAIRQQTEESSETSTHGRASAASLMTDLVLARQEVKALRAENEKLRRRAQRLLGQQLDHIGLEELIARVDQLNSENHRLTSELRQTKDERADLRSQVGELEESAAGARTALRRMIREQANDIYPVLTVDSS
jgi:cell division protein FtsB